MSEVSFYGRNMITETCSLTQASQSPGGGDSEMEQTGMLVGNFEFNP